MNSIEAFQALPQIKQRTAEWYKARETLITASKTASLLHLNSYHSYYDLLNETPSPPDLEPTPNITAENLKYMEATPIQWGTLLEPIALKHLEQTTQSPIGELGLKTHDIIPYLGGSPDGIQIIDGKPRLIEMKCPMRRKITYQVPLEYWVQMQICMAVWPEVKECLYAEYKFDLVTENPSKSPKPHGILNPDPKAPVYWILNKTWTKVIKYEPEWFRKIIPQMNHFYSLKYPSLSATQKRKTRISSITSSAKASKSTIISVPLTYLQNQTDFTPPSEASKLPHLFTINRLTNYLREDPILDWLELHKDEYLKDPSPFLDYYNQINLQYKLSTIEKVRKAAQEHDLTYRVLNASLNNLLDIPNYKDLMLKLQYDCHLLEETQDAMERGIDIIFMGQLGIKCESYTLWDTYDLMIRKDVFRLVFDDSKYANILMDFQNEYPNMEYIPIKVKLTTLKFLKDKKRLSSAHQMQKLRIGAITAGLIYDRQKTFALIPKLDENSSDFQTIKNGIKWLTQVEKTELSDLYPNMKNSYDSQWKSAKLYLADEKDELTQLSYLSVQTRNELHQEGITKISQLKPEHLNEIRNGTRIANFLPSNRLFLPQIDINATVEVFLDFESVSNLNKKPAQIFLAGLLIRTKTRTRRPKMNFIQYTVDKLTKDEEKSLVQLMIEKLSSLESDQPIPIYHWSQAEPRLLRESGFELPKNCYWVDMYSFFVNQNATIPGAYGYGLKEVATALKNQDKIKTGWTQGLDGNQAMIEAWLADRYCTQNPHQKFSELEEIRRVCQYNYVDCKVLEEIRDLL